jgi:hypothetical protein
MQAKSFWIMTGDGPPGLWKYSLCFDCANCASIAFGMIVLEKDGIVSFNYRRGLLDGNYYAYKYALGRIDGEKVSILCGLCEHANAVCHVYKSPDGTSSIELS